jgi:hypothetical protein
MLARAPEDIDEDAVPTRELGHVPDVAGAQASLLMPREKLKVALSQCTLVLSLLVVGWPPVARGGGCTDAEFAAGAGWEPSVAQSRRLSSTSWAT